METLLAWLGLMLYSMICANLVVHMGTPETIPDALSILLFLGFLPLLNAPMDWLSFGVTRGLLHAIADGHHGLWKSLAYGLLDLVLAFVFLLAVGLSSLAGIVLINALLAWHGAAPLVDLPQLWAQLLEGDLRSNLWIWLMLGSTLAPTFVHFVIVSFALALWFPQQKSTKVAKAMARKWQAFSVLNQAGKPELADRVTVDTDDRRKAMFYLLGANLVVVVMAAIFLLFGVLFLFIHLPAGIEWLIESIA